MAGSKTKREEVIPQRGRLVKRINSSGATPKGVTIGRDARKTNISHSHEEQRHESNVGKVQDKRMGWTLDTEGPREAASQRHFSAASQCRRSVAATNSKIISTRRARDIEEHKKLARQRKKAAGSA